VSLCLCGEDLIGGGSILLTLIFLFIREKRKNELTKMDKLVKFIGGGKKC